MEGTKGSRGVPSKSSSFLFFIGNTINGGTNCPTTDMHVTTVSKDPRSAEDSLCTSFLPFTVRILSILCCTVVMPVSSTLNTFDGSKLTFWSSGFKMLKNNLTFSLVNPCARLLDKAWGFLNERFGCRFRNNLSHFGAAFFLASENVVSNSQLKRHSLNPYMPRTFLVSDFNNFWIC